jgi:hypothetical protein
MGYRNIADFINRKRYPINIPSNIETPQIYEWSDGTFSTQMYEPVFHTLVPSKKTINDLIDFCFNRIDFQVCVDQEGRNPIFEIEWAVKTYLEEAQGLMHQISYRTDPEAQNIKMYLQKTDGAYRIFNKMLLKTIKKAKLYDNRIHPLDKLISGLRGIQT